MGKEGHQKIIEDNIGVGGLLKNIGYQLLLWGQNSPKYNIIILRKKILTPKI